MGTVAKLKGREEGWCGASGLRANSCEALLRTSGSAKDSAPHANEDTSGCMTESRQTTDWLRARALPHSIAGEVDSCSSEAQLKRQWQMHTATTAHCTLNYAHRHSKAR